jgi:2-amino-4-hydroxy-6-hydroxymethyldihydropteridine diphosphokinase
VNSGPVYLGLGSNLGDRAGFLQAAVRDLRSLPGFVLLRQAGLYSTAAVGESAGGEFVNTVVAGSYTGSPNELLDHCLEIEQKHGRERPYPWAPRTLDIDLLWWEGVTLESPRLTLPHPRLHERAFALVPLLELAPHLCLPRTGTPLSAALTPHVLSQGIEPFNHRPTLPGVARV